MKAAMRAAKGVRSATIDARAQFDALMVRVPPPGDVYIRNRLGWRCPGPLGSSCVESIWRSAQILFDHAGASGTVLAWELANEAQRA